MTFRHELIMHFLGCVARSGVEIDDYINSACSYADGVLTLIAKSEVKP